MMKKNSSRIVSAAIAVGIIGFSLQSCQEVELLDTAEKAYNHSYEESFVKTFGAVDPNQTWDFSTYAQGKRAQGQVTRAEEETPYIPRDAEGWYYLDTNVLTWIQGSIPQGHDNTSHITPTVFVTGDKETRIEIAPIYQGMAYRDWDFYLCYAPFHKEGEDVENVPATETFMWTKSTDIQKKTEGTNGELTGWRTLGRITSARTDQEKEAAHTNNAKEVRSKVIDFTVPANSFFYIKCVSELWGSDAVTLWQTGNGYVVSENGQNVITYRSSIGELDSPSAANVTYPNKKDKYHIIGVEDWYLYGDDDKDFEDCVFLIAGDFKIVDGEEPVEEVIAKRYLIEDLGSTYDWDFNDIVVDVTQTHTELWTLNNVNRRVKLVREETTQTAKVQYLCGTMPHQIQVGNTYFGQVTDPTNKEQSHNQLNTTFTDPSGYVYGQGTVYDRTNPTTPGVDPEVEEKEIEGWNPDENNVTAYVWQIDADLTKSPGNATSGVWTSTFPAPGTVPYMIAVDQTVEWNGEQVSIGVTHPEWLNGGDFSNN